MKSCKARQRANEVIVNISKFIIQWRATWHETAGKLTPGLYEQGINKIKNLSFFLIYFWL